MCRVSRHPQTDSCEPHVAWQGFSWSSLDYDLNWKLLHYTTRRYFAPFIVSGAKNDSVVTAYVTSDLMQPLAGDTLPLSPW